MKTLAIFPVEFLKTSIQWKKEGKRDNSGVFDYGRKVSPAVVFAQKDYSRVHCGDTPPLVAWCGVRAAGRFNVVRSCYIDASFNAVFAG